MRDRELSLSPGATQLGGVRADCQTYLVHLQEKHGEMHKAPEWVFFFLCAIRFGGFSLMSLYITLENEKKKKTRTKPESLRFGTSWAAGLLSARSPRLL